MKTLKIKVVFFVLILSLLSAVNTSFAIEKETKVALNDTNVVLSAPIELHLLSTDAPLVNSTVNLEHEDAWLFFNNIRPSEVISKYKSGILINGESLNIGSNGRMAIYRHGTVIMPHGDSYQPLTVFTGKDFEGEQNSFKVNVYNSSLGAFNNAIQSFKLKRGYMVTFANEADGTGYSRVFIANNEDLEMNLPDLLAGKVSFIRVFKYEWASKKGWAGWNETEWELTQSTWRYDWNAGGETTSNTEYVPIKQNLGWPAWSTIDSKNNVSHLLGYNEPDHVEQSDVTVDEAIAAWPEFMKSGLRLGAPATTNFNWVIDFVKRCDELNYRVDFVAVHAYWGNDPSSYYSSLNWVHQATGRPIWITEWNYGANWTNEWWPDNTWQLTAANEQYAYDKIKALVDFFDDTPWIERYSIYNWVEDRRAVVLNGKLTKAGEYYANNRSVEAYNPDFEVIPHWNYKAATLDFRYFALQNAIRLSWEDPNGELSQQYMLQKKVNSGSFETVYSTSDASEDYYLDPLDPAVYGNVSYRFSLQNAQGSLLTSNVVSYLQTAGENDIQLGKFELNNFDIGTTYFSKRYSLTPLLIMGIPSFENSFPLIPQVYSVTKTSYNSRISSWSYSGASEFSKTDLIAAMVLPAGIYDLKGLKAETQLVDGVGREWVSVNFTQDFDNIPVVFSTITTSSNLFPLTVGVRNVTTSGFEVCVKSEEAITTAINPATLNFFAAEPGTGVLDNKRITVGRKQGENGIASVPLEIAFDSTYIDPALFAGLLSSNNNFASALRYSLTGESVFEISKQREVSAGTTEEMQADDFGWMVIDLFADQPGVGTGIFETSKLSSLHFYPNPARQSINFNFYEPTRVEVVDLAGNKRIETVVLKELEISKLKAGIYILRAEGYSPAKLIKML